MDKRELRQQMRRLKHQLTDEQKQNEAATVFQAIERQMFGKDSHPSVLLYYSLADELPTHDIVDRWHTLGMPVYLPRMKGDDLEIVLYDGALRADNDFGVLEPQGVPSDITPDFIIVPGMAFDRDCNRLGRGRGFYDRMLRRCRDSIKIGVALSCQLVDVVPTDIHDIAMDHLFIGDGQSFTNPHHSEK